MKPRSTRMTPIVRTAGFSFFFATGLGTGFGAGLAGSAGLAGCGLGGCAACGLAGCAPGLAGCPAPGLAGCPGWAGFFGSFGVGVAMSSEPRVIVRRTGD